MVEYREKLKQPLKMSRVCETS